MQSAGWLQCFSVQVQEQYWEAKAGEGGDQVVLGYSEADPE